MKKLSLLLIVVISFIACNRVVTEGFVEYNFPHTDNLESVGEVEIPIQMGPLAGMMVKGGNITLFDLSSQFLINVFEQNSGRLRRKYLTYGREDYEIRSVVSVTPNVNSGRVVIDDQIKNRLYDIKIDSNPFARDDYRVSEYSDESHSRILQIGDSGLLRYGSSCNKMYTFDRGDRSFVEVIDYPKDPQVELSPSIAFIYGGYLISNEEQTKFLHASYYSDLFRLYSVDGGEVNILRHYQTRYPLYEDLSSESSLNVEVDIDNKSGFLSVATTSQYIYLLYGGRSYREYSRYSFCGERVYVLDWDGELIREIALDRDAKLISVDENDAMLYALMDDGNGLCVVNRYELK